MNQKNKWLQKPVLINFIAKGIGLFLIASGNVPLGTAILGGSGSIFNLAQGYVDKKDLTYNKLAADSFDSRKLLNTVFMTIIGVVMIFLGQVEEGTALITGAATTYSVGDALARSGDSYEDA